MNFGSLFSGIGGIDLGLERAGMTCAWQVEIDPWCRQMLAKHWPDVTQYEDVTKFCRRLYDCEPDELNDEVWCPRCEEDFSDCDCIGTDQLTDTHGFVDVICGGFPCQDVSIAGKRAGIEKGKRSGLWYEFSRIIRELRPRYVLVENVPGLLANGMGRVLGDLADAGYDAEWEVLSAASVGAPHLRKRVFITAHDRISDASGDSIREFGERGGREHTNSPSSISGNDGEEEQVADARSQRLQGTKFRYDNDAQAGRGKTGTTVPVAGCGGTQWKHWQFEPDVGRVALGVPRRVDRLRGLGNAVVPQCAERIGRQIMDAAAAEAGSSITPVGARPKRSALAE